jgi:hypothetical protein
MYDFEGDAYSCRFGLEKLGCGLVCLSLFAWHFVGPVGIQAPVLCPDTPQNFG